MNEALLCLIAACEEYLSATIGDDDLLEAINQFLENCKPEELGPFAVKIAKSK